MLRAKDFEFRPGRARVLWFKKKKVLDGPGLDRAFWSGLITFFLSKFYKVNSNFIDLILNYIFM